jgi:uncharacterized protein
MKEEKSFLGRGWAFPPEFDHKSLTVRMTTDEADIESSLHILLSTRVGERLMQPSFGCNLEVKDWVFTAIYYFEPRIEPIEVTFVANEEAGIINLIVEYRIKNTNTRHNIVYPFYLNEGTNI